MPRCVLSWGMTPALPTFSAHQRTCASRFFIVPADRPSACQRCTRASTCLPLSEFGVICRKPASLSWRATIVSPSSRSPCVEWLPSLLRRQSCRNPYVKSSIQPPSVACLVVFSEIELVSGIAESPRRDSRRTKARCSEHRFASNEASAALPGGRRGRGTAKDQQAGSGDENLL
ncbi:hypothetical protein FQZ97_828520 [compost metagenome]